MFVSEQYIAHSKKYSIHGTLHIVHSTQCLVLGTVEPRYNDLRYNDIPGITINNLLPTQQEL